MGLVEYIFRIPSGSGGSQNKVLPGVYLDTMGIVNTCKVEHAVIPCTPAPDQLTLITNHHKPSSLLAVRSPDLSRRLARGLESSVRRLGQGVAWINYPVPCRPSGLNEVQNKITWPFAGGYMELRSRPSM